LCLERGFLCDAEAKILGPKTQSRQPDSLQRSPPSITVLSPVPEERRFTELDWQLFECPITASRLVTAYSHAPSPMHRRRQFSVVLSSKPIRYALIANRATWIFSPSHTETLNYLNKFYRHARMELPNSPPLERLAVAFIMVSQSVTGKDLNACFVHMLHALKILLSMSDESCERKSAHMYWLLQAVNGGLSYLKHAMWTGSLILSSAPQEYSNCLPRLQAALELCSRIFARVSMNLPQASQQKPIWVSLRVSTLFQLLEFQAQIHWFQRTNLNTSKINQIMEGWDALKDTLRQIIDLIPQIGALTRPTFPFLVLPLTGITHENYAESDLLTLLYHMAVIMDYSLSTDPSSDRANVAVLSALATLSLCDTDQIYADDPFLQCVRGLSLFWATLLLITPLSRTRTSLADVNF
jgi:hypothetical protein